MRMDRNNPKMMLAPRNVSRANAYADKEQKSNWPATRPTVITTVLRNCWAKGMASKTRP